MKKTINKALNKIGEIPTLPLLSAVIIMLSALLFTCLSAIMIPIIILGLTTFYAGKIIIKKNDIISDYEKGNSNVEILENLKVLFAHSFNALFPDNKNSVPKLLINEIQTDVYTKSNITFYRLNFPVSVFQQIEFGTLENLKSELQENIDAFSMTARFHIPVYNSDKNNVLETTVRLHSIFMTDTNVYADLYIVENSNAFALYCESLK